MCLVADERAGPPGTADANTLGVVSTVRANPPLRTVQSPNEERVEQYVDRELEQSNQAFEAIIKAIIENARRGQSGRHSQQPQAESVTRSSAPKAGGQRLEGANGAGVQNAAPAAEISAAIDSTRAEVRSVSGASISTDAKIDELSASTSRNRGLMEYM